MLGVMAFSLNLVQLQRLFESVALPDGSVVTLIDQQRPDCRPESLRAHDTSVATVDPAVMTTVDAEMSPVLRRTSMASSGSSAPCSRPRAVDAQCRYPARAGRRLGSSRCGGGTLFISGGAVFAVLALALLGVASHQQWPEPPAVGRAAHRGRRSVPAAARGCAEPRGRGTAGRLHHDGGEPAGDARRARSPGGAGTEDAGDAPVAAASGCPPGAARRGRPPGLGGRARVEQSASGDSRHGGAARARSGHQRRRSSRRSRCSRRRAAGRARSSGTCRGSAASSRARRRSSISEPSSPKSFNCGGTIWRNRRSRSTSSPTPSGKVYANITELEQVTLNFVINAQQAIESAHREHGRILIRLIDDGRKVRLEVQDDGPGVVAGERAEAVPAFLHHQAGRSGNRPRDCRSATGSSTRTAA